MSRVEHLPEHRQGELLPPRDGDPRAVAGPLERGDAIVVGGGAVLAQHGLPVQPVTVGFILDHLQLAHIDRLALIQHQVVGLRQIDVALRLAHRPPRRVVRQRDHDAAEIVVHELDGAGDVDTPHEQRKIDGQRSRVAEHHGFIDVLPAKLAGNLRRGCGDRFEPAQFVHQRIERAFRYGVEIEAEWHRVPAQRILVEQRPI